MYPTVCSNLASLDVCYCEPNEADSLLSWAFPGNKPNKNLTGLNVTNCTFSEIFPLLCKLPALRKLNLAKSLLISTSLKSFPNLQHLESLELQDVRDIWGEELPELSKSVGKTLRYLGLADQNFLKDRHLQDLACMFPVLRNLDLSRCLQISDAILVEWYIKHGESRWPKLRKLVLKGCEQITQEVVDFVRLKTRNQLLIDLWIFVVNYLTGLPGASLLLKLIRTVVKSILVVKPTGLVI